MARETQHVVPNVNKGWSVKKEGANKASRNFDDKASAVKFAKQFSKKRSTELIIHKKDGTIQSYTSYAACPNSPKEKLK